MERHLEHLQPTVEDLSLVPDWLHKHSEQHLRRLERPKVSPPSG